ncbi:hypothetical protein [Clostridium sp. AN503]|uniref:hypothetical protein n=1 Tax=Clostridium sp. AN503 TaxID=3160598 RepID=UPI0034583DCD
MGNIPWFSMMSRRDREKKERKYKEQMFPFGEPQRDWEQAILKELFPQVKDGDQLLYQLLCAKECLLEEDPDWREEGLAKWLNSSLMQRFSAEERMMILALAWLEQGRASLEEFPDREQVLKKAAELESRKQLE